MSLCVEGLWHHDEVKAFKTLRYIKELVAPSKKASSPIPSPIFPLSLTSPPSYPIASHTLAFLPFLPLPPFLPSPIHLSSSPVTLSLTTLPKSPPSIL